MATTVKPRRRTRRRVEDTESSGNKVTKSARHKQTTPRPEGAVKIVEGDLHITAQLSELVPVAQYANVTIGPVQIAWKLGSVEMEALLDVDWDEIEDSDDIADKLDERQLAAWQRARQGLRSTMMLLEFTIAEDRMAVERSVAQYNKDEAEASKKK